MLRQKTKKNEKRLQRLFWLEKVRSDDGRIPDGDMVSSVASLSQASGPFGHSRDLVHRQRQRQLSLLQHDPWQAHRVPCMPLTRASLLYSPLLSSPHLASSRLSHFFSSPLLFSSLIAPGRQVICRQSHGFPQPHGSTISTNGVEYGASGDAGPRGSSRSEPGFQQIQLL